MKNEYSYMYSKALELHHRNINTKIRISYGSSNDTVFVGVGIPGRSLVVELTLNEGW